jgi:hypothetical protein
VVAHIAKSIVKAVLNARGYIRIQIISVRRRLLQVRQYVLFAGINTGAILRRVKMLLEQVEITQAPAYEQRVLIYIAVTFITIFYAGICRITLIKVITIG